MRVDLLLKQSSPVHLADSDTTKPQVKIISVFFIYIFPFMVELSRILDLRLAHSITQTHLEVYMLHNALLLVMSCAAISRGFVVAHCEAQGM